ncbi:hypothetical protein BKA81DRAFT_57054 [Phyllosticta paracitricarpa]
MDTISLRYIRFTQMPLQPRSGCCSAALRRLGPNGGELGIKSHAPKTSRATPAAKAWDSDRILPLLRSQKTPGFKSDAGSGTPVETAMSVDPSANILTIRSYPSQDRIIKSVCTHISTRRNVSLDFFL